MQSPVADSNDFDILSEWQDYLDITRSLDSK